MTASCSEDTGTGISVSNDHLSIKEILLYNVVGILEGV